MSEKKKSEVLNYRDQVFQLGIAPEKDRERLYEFVKEETYVDVIITLDDGTRISCHRYVFLLTLTVSLLCLGILKLLPLSKHCLTHFINAVLPN